MQVTPADEYCPHCGAKIGEHTPVPAWQIHRRMYNWVLAWAYRPTAAVALFMLAFAESSFFPIPPDVLLMPLVLGNRKKWFRYALLCSVASILGGVFGFLIGWQLWESSFEILACALGAIAGLPLGWALFRKKPRGLMIAMTTLVTLIVGGSGFALGRWGWDGTTANLFFHVIPGFDQATFDKVSGYYNQYNFWIVFTAGFTPIPFKVITITAGVFGTGDKVPSPGGFFAMFLIAAAVSRSARFFLVSGLMRLFGPKITPFIDKYFNWLALLFTALLIGGFVVIKMVTH